MKNPIIIGILLSVLLTGCGFLEKFREPKVEPPAVNTKVVVAPELLQPCEPLPTLTTQPNFDDIAHHYITTIGMYATCRMKQEDSIKAIRKLSNTETSQ